MWFTHCVLIKVVKLEWLGDMIKNASADNDPTQGGIVVTMTMKPDAAEDWRRMTADNASNDEDKKYVAVVLDGKVYSAPGVTSEIAGGNTQISGNFDIKEAQDLANVLKAGKLPVPLQIIAEDVVGPTLGAQNISAGFRALLMGFYRNYIIHDCILSPCWIYC